jgi:glutaredoxin-related protein
VELRTTFPTSDGQPGHWWAKRKNMLGLIHAKCNECWSAKEQIMNKEKKDKEEKRSEVTKPQAKILEFLALREKQHRFDQLMRQERLDHDEQFGPVWQSVFGKPFPPRPPEELEVLFARMFGDLRS